MLRTHRSRLTVAAASATGILLALVFAGVVFGARQAAIAQKRGELQSALNELAGDSDRLEINDFREAHPEMSMSVFEASGRVSRSLGKLALAPVVGFARNATVLSSGLRRGSTVVVVGADWTEVDRGLRRLALWLGLLWLPLTCLCGAVTWAAARAVFRPLERLSTQAEAIGRTNLTDRLETEDQAEFGAFAQQLNRMLDRIEASVEREERFASDAAHELRTPLAILRVRLESTLMRRRTASEYVDAQRDALAELERLSRVVESLLQTTRVHTSQQSLAMVGDVVKQTAARWQDRYISGSVQLVVESVNVKAEIGEDELAIVIDNLLDNALRFSTPGLSVKLQASVASDAVEVSVSDEGPGIDPEIGDRVFDRFVRADDGRNRESGGAGIGLSVCRRIVEARGGSISLRQDGQSGATIVCRLKSA
ncbi:MAG: HAMP domain-containing sensor histidine kinase [Fimbriimonadaceae bacterium]